MLLKRWLIFWSCFLIGAVVKAQIACPAGQVVSSQVVNTGQVCTVVAGAQAFALTASLGGTPILLGGTLTGTATATGATVGQVCKANASDGSLPTAGMVVDCAVTSANTVTVQLTAIVALTPAAKTYNVRVLP